MIPESGLGAYLSQARMYLWLELVVKLRRYRTITTTPPVTAPAVQTFRDTMIGSVGEHRGLGGQCIEILSGDHLT